MISEKLLTMKKVVAQKIGAIPQLVNFAQRMNNCFSTVYTVKTGCGKKKKAVFNRCKLRFCPVCGQIRRDIMLESYYDVFHNMKNPYMLTLTIPDINTLEKKDIKELSEAFQKMRRAKVWTESITGGLSSLEITYTDNDKWHPHLHILLDFKTINTQYLIKHIDKKILSLAAIPENTSKPLLELYAHLKSVNPEPDEPIDEKYIPPFFSNYIKAGEALFLIWIYASWYEKTGGYILNLQKTDEKGLVEIFKYITKVTDFFEDEERIIEFVRAVDGRRFVASFGKYYNYVSEESVDEKIDKRIIETERNDDFIFASQYTICGKDKKYIRLKCKDCVKGKGKGCRAYLRGSLDDEKLKQLTLLGEYLKNPLSRLKGYTPAEVAKVFEEKRHKTKYSIPAKMERDNFLQRKRDENYYLNRSAKHFYTQLEKEHEKQRDELQASDMFRLHEFETGKVFFNIAEIEIKRKEEEEQKRKQHLEFIEKLNARFENEKVGK